MALLAATTPGRVTRAKPVNIRFYRSRRSGGDQEQTTVPGAGVWQVGVHAVDPDKMATSVATTATTFSVLLVLVIGVPSSLWLDVCLIGCYSRYRRSGWF